MVLSSPALRRLARLAGHVELEASPTEAADDVEVMIIGAGFSGIFCAVKLMDANIIPKNRIQLVDAGSDFGGTWHWNRYPGCACDVQSYDYLPYLERTGFVPSKKYVSHQEISDYIRLMANKLGCYDIIEFNTAVEGLEWQEATQNWKVTTQTTKDGEVLAGDMGMVKGVEKTRTAKMCIACCGGLVVPKMPPGVDFSRFKGEIYHTARWNVDHRTHFKGKRVGIVGSGCSAGQTLIDLAFPNGFDPQNKTAPTSPAMDAQVKRRISELDDGANDGSESDDCLPSELFMFARTQSYAMPREDGPTSDRMKQNLATPGWHDKFRSGNITAFDKGFFPFLREDNFKTLGGMSEIAKMLIRRTIKDKQLAEQMVPDYNIFCKRVLVLDGYYEAFNQKRVHYVLDRGGVVGADEKGIITADGRHFDLDIIVCATGYDLGEATLPRVIGKNGENMRAKFGAKQLPNGDYESFMPQPKTVFGNHVKGFPNLFLMTWGLQGINPVTNVTYAMEMHANYVVQLIGDMKKKGQTICDVTEEAEKEWQEHVVEQQDGTIWTSGCSGRGNWYTRTGPNGAEGNGGVNYTLYFGSHTTLRTEVEKRKERYLVFQNAPAGATA